MAFGIATLQIMLKITFTILLQKPHEAQQTAFVYHETQCVDEDGCLLGQGTTSQKSSEIPHSTQMFM
jgi:hypothetical protein